MISVVVSAYNEEKNIKECIKSVEEFADEIIVVDNSSEDRTSEIAKKLGAKVFTQANNPKKIDLQKNFGYDKATQEWILSLDADERVSQRLAQEIIKAVQTEEVSGYYIPRKNIIFGKWIKHSLWWPDYQLRLFRRGRGKFVSATVHQPISVKGEVRHLSEPLTHYNYATISQSVNRMNSIYTEIEADEIIREKEKLPWTQVIKMPASAFLNTFFLQKGYKDGLHGLVLSILQAFYLFLVFVKVWEKQGFYEKDQKEMLKGLEKEFETFLLQTRFWFFNSFKHETRNPFKRALYMYAKKLLKY